MLKNTVPRCFIRICDAPPLNTWMEYFNRIRPSNAVIFRRNLPTLSSSSFPRIYLYSGHNDRRNVRYSPLQSKPICDKREHSYRFLQTESQDTRTVEIKKAAQRKLIRKKPQKLQDARVLKVAIIGPPNAGKSTLANQLIGWKFAGVSKKVHTTRHKAIGVCTENNTQIIFLDTPGLTTQEKVKRHNLERTLLTDPYSSLFEADLILAVIDASAVWNRSRLDSDVLTALYLHHKTPSILVLNKVDLVRRKLDLLTTTRLLTDGIVGGLPGLHFSPKPQSEASYEDIISKIKTHKLKTDLDETREDCSGDIDNIVSDNNPDMLVDISPSDDKWWTVYQKKLRHARAAVEKRRGWDRFDRVFMVSALDGGGVQDIKEYLLESASPGPWHYHSSMITDQEPLELAEMCIREKLMDHLPDEVPYNVEIKVSMWEIEENMLRGAFHLICSKKRYAVRLLGNDGETIRKIAAEAKQELMNTFKRDLTLKLLVITKAKPK